MAAWTTIPDSDVDPESPITTSLMQALRDNPVAIAETAVGAPDFSGNPAFTHASGLRTNTVTERTTGAGVAIDSVVGSTKAGTGEKLLTKVIKIGNWDMVADNSVSITHGLTFSDIRGAIVFVKNDTNNQLFIFPSVAWGGTNPTSDETIAIDATTITLTRATGGAYDNSAFDDTPFERGFIIIIHKD